MSAPETLKAIPILWNDSTVAAAASVNQAGVDATGYKRIKGAISLPAGSVAPTTILVRQGNDVTTWQSSRTIAQDLSETTADVYPIDIDIIFPYVGIFFTQGAVAGGTAQVKAYVELLPE